MKKRGDRESEGLAAREAKAVSEANQQVHIICVNLLDRRESD